MPNAQRQLMSWVSVDPERSGARARRVHLGLPVVLGAVTSSTPNKAGAVHGTTHTTHTTLAALLPLVLHPAAMKRPCICLRVQVFSLPTTCSLFSSSPQRSISSHLGGAPRMSQPVGGAPRMLTAMSEREAPVPGQHAQKQRPSGK